MQQPHARDHAPDEVARLSAALVTQASRLVRAVARKGSPEIPAASLRLLAQIEEHAPIGISDLARADRCSQPTMSAAVASLCERGWITKQPNPADARSSLTRLTDEGAAVLSAARRRNADVVRERFDADPSHDLSDLRTAVSLLENLLRRTPLE